MRLYLRTPYSLLITHYSSLLSLLRATTPETQALRLYCGPLSYSPLSTHYSLLTTLFPSSPLLIFSYSRSIVLSFRHSFVPSCCRAVQSCEYLRDASIASLLVDITHYSLLTTQNSLLTTHHSPLKTHHSKLTTHHYSSLLTTHYFFHPSSAFSPASSGKTSFPGIRFPAVYLRLPVSRSVSNPFRLS